VFKLAIFHGKNLSELKSFPTDELRIGFYEGAKYGVALYNGGYLGDVPMYYYPEESNMMPTPLREQVESLVSSKKEPA